MIQKDIKNYILMCMLTSLQPFTKGLRWKEIRDIALASTRREGIEILPSEMPNYNMKTTRILEKMVNENLMHKKNLGHKQTYYILNKEETQHHFLKQPMINMEWQKDNIRSLINGEYAEDIDQHISSFLMIVRLFSSVSKRINLATEFEVYKSVIMEKIEELMEPKIKEYYEMERRYRAGTEESRELLGIY